MAPNRKKKKPASNPNRGFATVSIPKPKDNVEEISGSDAKELGNGVPPAKEIGFDIENATSTPAQTATAKQEVEDLSPEEFERQLEESDFQLTIEKYREKAQRDASRQATRLQAERRMVRPQAETLYVNSWLPLELMQLATQYLEMQEDSRPVSAMTESRKQVSVESEEDLTAKLWVLQQILFQLGFEDTDSTLTHLLRISQEARSLPVGKDSVWGLEECIDWLALRCDLDSVLQSSNHRSRSPAADPTVDMLTTAGEAPPNSSLLMPAGEDDVEQLSKVQSAETVAPPNHDMDSVDNESSDSDIEPELMQREYVSLLSRLFEIAPNLTYAGPTSKKNKSQKKGLGSNLATSMNARISRLLAKISKLESDILFDQYEAQQQWLKVRDQLTQESPIQHRLGHDANDDSSGGSTTSPLDHLEVPGELSFFNSQEIT